MGLEIAWKARDCMKGNLSGFDSRMGLVISRKDLKKYNFKRVLPQASEKDLIALYLGVRMDLMLEWGS
ncbi:uncharacterized protein G2W53_022097 [Senna tora]|uniref:Uncharacterized protein n=1 Tax=Senna tora TaxID=362788 RepID=A0A834WK59_9FABA|nr:uncharacterized protein G2W53_022097 [Senna tora]